MSIAVPTNAPGSDGALNLACVSNAAMRLFLVGIVVRSIWMAMLPGRRKHGSARKKQTTR